MTGRSLSRSIRTDAKNTNLPHNNREEEEIKKKRNKHIDQKRIKDNVYLKQEPIEKKYEEIFGEAQEKYNEKQKRKDRKIDNYYEQVKNSKTTHVQREMIVQVGSVEDIESGNLTREEGKEMLEEYYKDFEERNPNLKVYNAVIHMDEATPHMHLNFIPVGTDYKRGMDKQVAFNRALSQQDDSFNKSRPFEDWRDSEIEVLDSIMASRSIDIKEVGANHKYMTHDRYKEVKDREKKIAKKEEKVEEVENKLREKAGNLNNQAKSLVEEAFKGKSDELSEKEKDLKKKEEDLKKKEQKQSAKGLELTEEEKRLVERASNINESVRKINSDIEKTRENLDTKEKEVEAKEKEVDTREKEVEAKEVKASEMYKKGVEMYKEGKNMFKKALTFEEIARKLLETYNQISEKIKKGIIKPEEVIKAEEETKERLKPFGKDNPEHLLSLDEALKDLDKEDTMKL